MIFKNCAVNLTQHEFLNTHWHKRAKVSRKIPKVIKDTTTETTNSTKPTEKLLSFLENTEKKPKN